MNKRKMLPKLLLLTLLLGFFMLPSNRVSAATTTEITINNSVLSFNKVFYVDETNGDDTNGDGSAENPYNTFDVAYDQITDDNNEAIYLQKGTYTISTSDTKLKIMSIIGEGKDTVLNPNHALRRINNENGVAAGVMYDISDLKIYKLIFRTNVVAGNVLYSCNTQFFNVAFQINTAANYGSFVAYKSITRPTYFYNCIDVSSTDNIIRGYAVIQNCYGLFEIGYGTTESNITRTTSLTETPNIDGNYNILSTGWENSGTGTNPDGSVANMGVYGGEYAWDDTEIAIASPTNLKATAGDSGVSLTWSAVSGSAISYTVKRSETSSGSYTTLAAGVTATTYTDTTVTNGTTYYYVVIATDSSGTESADSNEASATPIAQVSALKLVIEVKEEKQLSVADDLNNNADMTWTSSDTFVAIVDSNGIVTGVKAGDAIITVTNEDGSYTDTINVLVVDLDLQLAVDLYVGDTCRLTVDDLADTENVTWTSYDPIIATVNSKGKVTAISEGLTFISAMDEQGNEIGRIYIRVRQSN